MKRKDGEKNKSKSSRCGLVFNVGRLDSRMKKGNFAERVSPGAAVYLTAILEYMTAEVLELAGNAAMDNKKIRINPRHLMLAVRHDEELSKLFGHITFAQGGVVPSVHPSLLHRKNSRKGEAAEDLNESAGNA
uniref:Histone H2A n=1 Tax=Steinernema glaseri TaxID=37863 RepID=A0A1I7YGS5_9BILA